MIKLYGFTATTTENDKTYSIKVTALKLQPMIIPGNDTLYPIEIEVTSIPQNIPDSVHQLHKLEYKLECDVLLWIPTYEIQMLYDNPVGFYKENIKSDPTKYSVLLNKEYGDYGN